MPQWLKCKWCNKPYLGSQWQGECLTCGKARRSHYNTVFCQYNNGRWPLSVKILWDDSVQAYRVATPYNPNFVETLKQLIPASDRHWDPTSKIWTVNEAFGMPIRKMCESIYGAGSVTFVSKQDAANIAAQRAAAAAQAAQQAHAQYQYIPPPPPKTPQRGDSLDVTLLAFVRTLPYEAAKAAYRNAAAALHPDRGGDASKMTTLNMCWSRIEKELYGKGGSL